MWRNIQRPQCTCSCFRLFTLSILKFVHKLLKISTQTYLNGNGELFIFIADLNRVAKLTAAAGQSLDRLGRMDKVSAGECRCYTAFQNMVVASESLGLGTVTLWQYSK